MRLIASFLLGLVCAGPARASIVPEVIKAIEVVESSSRPHAIGDGQMAIGILQVHQVMLDDARRIAGVRYSLQDMRDPVKAERVALVVLSHYEDFIHRRTGRPATAKELSFIWNGGGGAWTRAQNPKRDRKQAWLEYYWTKVRAVLNLSRERRERS